MIKRYEMETDGEPVYPMPGEDGMWVAYDDHIAALTAERDAERAKARELMEAVVVSRHQRDKSDANAHNDAKRNHQTRTELLEAKATIADLHALAKLVMEWEKAMGKWEDNERSSLNQIVADDKALQKARDAMLAKAREVVSDD